MSPRKGRPPSANPMVHTAIVLPRDLISNLKAAAAAADHGLSTEIRARLNRQFTPAVKEVMLLPHEVPMKELYDRIDLALADLRIELRKAMEKHFPMNSAHEGHSVIREELDELWDHVKADTGHTDAARREALQVAAMGLRYALDVCG